MSNKIKPKKPQSEILSDVKYFDDITTLQIIMAIHRQSGACFAKAHYNKGDAIQENFVSGFLTAFSSFERVIGEQLGSNNGNSSTKSITYGDFTVTIFDNDFLRISLISKEPIGKAMKQRCERLTLNYEKKNYPHLENFSGSMDIFMDFPEFVEKELDVKLNYKSKINVHSLERYDCPKAIRKVYTEMAKLDETFYPSEIPSILMREAELPEAIAKYYTYESYLWYLFEPIEN